MHPGIFVQNQTDRLHIFVIIPKRNEIANGITIRTLQKLKNFRKLSYDWYIRLVSYDSINE